MSMTTHVYGFHAPDAKWRQMKTIFDACDEAGVEIPEEVDTYFNGEPPEEHGVLESLENHPACTHYHEDMRDGFEIDVKMLPEHIRHIRFVNSY